MLYVLSINCEDYAEFLFSERLRSLTSYYTYVERLYGAEKSLHSVWTYQNEYTCKACLVFNAHVVCPSVKNQAGRYSARACVFSWFLTHALHAHAFTHAIRVRIRYVYTCDTRAYSFSYAHTLCHNCSSQFNKNQLLLEIQRKVRKLQFASECDSNSIPTMLVLRRIIAWAYATSSPRIGPTILQWNFVQRFHQRFGYKNFFCLFIPGTLQ